MVKRRRLRNINAASENIDGLTAGTFSTIQLVNPLAESTTLRISNEEDDPSRRVVRNELQLSPIPARVMQPVDRRTQRARLERLMTRKMSRWTGASSSKPPTEDLSKLNCTMPVDEEGCDPELVSQIGIDRMRGEGNQLVGNRKMLIAPRTLAVSSEDKENHCRSVIEAVDAEEPPQEQPQPRIEKGLDDPGIGRKMDAEEKVEGSEPGVEKARKAECEVDDQIVMMSREDMVNACTRSSASQHTFPLLDGTNGNHKLVVIKPGSQKAISTHANSQTVCVVQGKGVVIIEGKSYELTKYSQITLPPRLRVIAKNMGLRDYILWKFIEAVTE